MLLSMLFVCKYDTIQLQWEYKDDLYYIGYAAFRFSLHVSTTQVTRQLQWEVQFNYT